MSAESDNLYKLLESLYGGDLSTLDPNAFSELVHFIATKTNTALITPQELQIRLADLPLEKIQYLTTHMKQLQKLNSQSST